MTEYVRVPMALSDWLYGVEGYGLRVERLSEELRDPVDKLLPWLLAAFEVGLAASPQGQGDCVCVQRGDGPEGCGLCNETGVVTSPASPQGEDGWITHDGGPNPVPGKMVECKLAGTSFPMAALPSECLNWAADLRFGGSIIAYRVTEGVKP